MDFSLFHFSDPEWLYGLAIIPFILILYYFIRPASSKDQEKLLEKFIDKHLLPHLIIKNSNNKKQGSAIYSLAMWSIIWCLLMLSMAGPRWSYREFQMYVPEQKAVILLDLSRSMDADDITPTRISRARLEIEEIIRLNPELSIGMIGFAAHAHMISPITRDHDNIKYLLPLVGTDLISVQGSRLLPALKMADDMLISKNNANTKTSNGSLIILSDGGFQDSESFNFLQKLASKGITVHTIGIGTDKGSNLLDNKGKQVMHNGKPVKFKFDEDRLKEVSRIGRGAYFISHYSDRNAIAIRSIFDKQSDQFQESMQTTQHWDERFYIFILPILFIIIFWFRRGFIFPLILVAMLLPSTSQATSNLDAANNFNDWTSRLLLNDQNLAKKLVEEKEDPEAALNYLDDSYRKGIAYYRNQEYAKAEREFRNNKRPEVAKESLYNLGNALVMQGKIEEAKDAYKKAIELDENYQDAKYNLALLEQEQDQQQQQDQGSSKQDNENQDSQDQQNSGEQGDDSNNQEENDQGKDNTDDQGGEDNQDDRDDSGQDSDNKDQMEDKSNSSNDQQQNNQQNSGDTNDDNDSPPAADGEQNDQQEEGTGERSEQNVDIDDWLNRISDDHKNFLKNQFYVESMRQMQQEKLDGNLDPW